MIQNKTLKTASILGALALMVGGVVAVDAASGRNISNNQSFDGVSMHERGGMMRGEMQELSEEERTQKITDMEDGRDLRRAEMEANREAVEEAISENSFENWQAAIGENHPFAEKITAENFSTFVEIHKSMEANREKLAELGIEQNKEGFGLGRGMGQGDCQMINN